MTVEDQQSGLAVPGTQIRLLSATKEVLQVPHCVVGLLTCGVQYDGGIHTVCYFVQNQYSVWTYCRSANAKQLCFKRPLCVDFLPPFLCEGGRCCFRKLPTGRMVTFECDTRTSISVVGGTRNRDLTLGLTLKKAKTSTGLPLFQLYVTAAITKGTRDPEYQLGALNKLRATHSR